MGFNRNCFNKPHRSPLFLVLSFSIFIRLDISSICTRVFHLVAFTFNSDPFCLDSPSYLYATSVSFYVPIFNLNKKQYAKYNNNNNTKKTHTPNSLKSNDRDSY